MLSLLLQSPLRLGVGEAGVDLAQRLLVVDRVLRRSVKKLCFNHCVSLMVSKQVRVCGLWNRARYRSRTTMQRYEIKCPIPIFPDFYLTFISFAYNGTSSLPARYSIVLATQRCSNSPDPLRRF